jgi:hypothetical protein
METQQTINQHLLEEELYNDFETHLQEIVLDRFEKFDNDLKGKSLYFLKITKTPKREDYHKFDFVKFNEISRGLVNGMTSLGTIPNRKFWNRYFLGGVRTISIYQEDLDKFPSFNLNFIIFSELDNLDVRINTQLSTRIKMIDPTLTITFEYLGLYNISRIIEYLDTSTKIHMNSPITKKLGKRNLDLMGFNPLQRPRFIGGLFKPYKIPLMKD